MPLSQGFYEKVINEETSRELASIEQSAPSVTIAQEVIDSAEAPKILARYLATIAEQGLTQLAEREKDDAQGEQQKQKKFLTLTNKIVNLICSEVSATTDDSEYYASQRIPSPPQQLSSILDFQNTIFALDAKKQPVRPESPLSLSSLFTGASGEPQMYSELIKEIESCDRIDILVSFIKWSGLVKLLDSLKKFCEHKHLRIMTTSYMGATDAKAIKVLAELSNTEVKVSYDTKTTRLHAKAYIFHRNTGYSTAYIGSSNISHAALTTGLEWNIKLTQQDQPETFSKVRATFESYWNSKDFELFTIADFEKLKIALRGERLSGNQQDKSFLFDIQPYPFQQEILDKLDAERTVHDKHRNLVVAATGTGKTVISALDYRRFCNTTSPRPRLLFVAHRQEILTQSLNCFRGVLRDPNFGDLLVGGFKPSSLEHLFISIQSFNSQQLFQHTSSDYYDYIVVDEFHHAAADSYKKLLKHYRPKVLLGLTATPERMDGKDVLSQFDGRIAAEIRLPEAINRQLLCPFQYYGCTDEPSIDLSHVSWKQGKYDANELTRIYTFDEVVARKRATLILESTEHYLADIHKAKGIGFCVSQKHAQFMAGFFNENKIPSMSLTSESKTEERDACKRKLESGEINFVFVVDLYNEGVDIPAVNTVLFLRPTESLTVFLQQLGRGLRLAPGKECLTVLDFIAQAHQKYDFESKFNSLLDGGHKSLEREIKAGFINVPKGCFIKLEKIAQEYILNNIAGSRGYKAKILSLLKSFVEDTGKELSLTNFAKEYNLNLRTFYSKCDSFSDMCVAAGVRAPFDEPLQKTKSKGAFLTLAGINSWHWIDTILPLLKMSSFVHSLTNEQRTMLQMFRCSLWNMNNYECTDEQLLNEIESLQKSPILLQEILEVLSIGRSRITIVEKAPNLPYACPLDVYCSYTRDQLFIALGNMKPNTVREGVKWIKDLNTDVFLVTLNKSEKNYSPTTLYEDYAINSELFHWQSQSTTSEDSSTGQRYILHKKRGTHILLFVRENKKDDCGTPPYIFLGTANYVTHTGSRPMSITLRLDNPIPGNLQLKTVKLLAG